MTHLFQTAFQQNPNVGLEGFANDKVCFITRAATKKQQETIHKVLKVPIHSLNMCGTTLVGVFIAGNNNKLLLPPIAFDEEVKVLDKAKIPYHILDTHHTALGNNIVANDNAALINPELEDWKDEIKKELGVKKIQSYEIAKIPIIGALLSLNDKGCLLSAYASEEDEAFIKKFFNLPVTRGTVNLGSPYVKSGIITNKNGFIFGSKTGGPEAIAIDDALGFLQ